MFPHEPILRVRGPILQAQLVETALLTLVNFQTLVATKAARVRQAARGAPVLEFGLRRAQGIDGGLARVARRVHRRLRRDLERARRQAVRHPGQRHARAQLGDVPSTTSSRRSAPTPTRCPATARSSSTPTTRSRACATRSTVGQRAARAGPRARRHPARLRRPRVPVDRGARDARRRGLPETRRSSRPTTSTRPDRAASTSRARGSTSGASAPSSSPASTSRRSAASTSSARSATATALADAGQGQLRHGEDHRPRQARPAPLLRRGRHRPRGHDLGRPPRPRRVTRDRRSRRLRTTG